MFDGQHVVGGDHQAGDPHLLVDATGHHRLVDTLIRPADEVAIEIHIQIVDGLDIGQGLIDEDIVHIEGMFGQFQRAVPEQLGAVDHRVHEQILGGAEVADLIPGENAADGEHIFVVHRLAGVVLHVLVDVVGHHHVHRGGHMGELAQLGHDGVQSVLVQPVVRVHHLIIYAPGVADALVDALAVAAVFLVDGPDDVGVLGGPRIALGRSVVFGGAVVHQNDLDVLACGQQRLHAVVHVGGGVVAGDGKCNDLIHGIVLPLPCYDMPFQQKVSR